MTSLSSFFVFFKKHFIITGLFALSLTVILSTGCSSTSTSTSDDNGGSTCLGSTCDTDNTDNELVSIGDFTYLGAFRISSDTFGDSTVEYAIGTLAYNPDNNSLFIAGHNYHSAVGEFAIPELLDEDSVLDLNVVETPLQNFRSVLGTTSDVSEEDEQIECPVTNPDGINRITGLLYIDGQLIVNAEEWYDAGADNEDTTLVLRDADNLDSSDIEGFYSLTGAATSAGYMAAIPLEWQTDFAGQYLTGWSSVYSIVSRYSVGPSLFVFDPNNILDDTSGSGSVSATAFMNFAYSNGHYLADDALEETEGSASALWNFLSRGVYGFIIPGTRTFAVFGSSGGVESGIGYKITQDNDYLCGGFCSYAAADNYNYYWLFDVREILDATEVYNIEPYAYGEFSVPFDNNGLNRIAGGAFDSTNNILYLTIENAGQIGEFDQPPVIVGYSVPVQ